MVIHNATMWIDNDIKLIWHVNKRYFFENKSITEV